MDPTSILIIPPITRKLTDHQGQDLVLGPFSRPSLPEEDEVGDEAGTAPVQASVPAEEEGPSLDVQECDSASVIRYPDQRERLLQLMQSLSSYHYLDEVGSVCFALAVAASNHADRQPLWGMLVGAPSGGKTTAIDLVSYATSANLDSVTAPGLLSWHKANQHAPSVPTGALVRLGDRGLLTVADFSTVLSGNRDRRDDLFAMLRRVFDGKIQRDLGNENQALTWEGRVTFLAACTSTIDNYSAHTDALGPRWVNYRLPPRVGAPRKAVTRRAVKRSEDQNRIADEVKAMEGAAVVVGLAGFNARKEHLDDEHIISAVEDAAQVVCWGRASVPRDSGSRRDVCGIPEVEETPRVAQQLHMLLTHLVHIGLSDDEAINLMSKVAIDSMPAIRAKVLGALASWSGEFTSAALARLLHLDWKVVNRAVEDFEALTLVTRVERPASFTNTGAAEAKPWVFDHEDADAIREIFGRAVVPVLPEVTLGASSEVSGAVTP
jgi:hypothetical protein